MAGSSSIDDGVESGDFCDLASSADVSPDAFATSTFLESSVLAEGD